jgi:hypothetical protein
MVQEIISLVIVGGAIIYAFYAMIKFLIPNKQKAANGSCGGGACHCKPELFSNPKKQQHRHGRYKHVKLQ